MSITETELYQKLSEFMAGKTQPQAAKELGISIGYLHRIIHKRNPIVCPAILRKFGLKKVVLIERTEV